MNIYTTPIALQRASAIKYNEFYVTFFIANPTINSMSSEGNIYICTTYNGARTVESYTNLERTAVSIKADAGTLIRIVGNLTYISLPYDGDYPASGGTKRVESINTNSCRTLQTLDIKGISSITSLDLSQNTALTDLYCYNSGITSLDLSQNTALTNLNCSYTGITSLDLSQNTALTNLNCSYTGITSLDLSQNTALTNLNISLCSKLTSISCTAAEQTIAKNVSYFISQYASLKGTVTVYAPLTYASIISTAASEEGWTYKEA